LMLLLHVSIVTLSRYAVNRCAGGGRECVLKHTNNACYAVPYYGFGRPYNML